MDTATPGTGAFFVFIVIPLIVGAVIGAMSDRQSAVRGVMVGGIAGALIGYFAMILVSETG